MRNHAASHLKLVVSKEAVPATDRPTKARAPQQLALPFVDSFTAVLVNVREIDREDFIELLEVVRPKWIFDARATPRLDVLGGTRGYVFQLFEKSGIDYVDVFGRMGLANYRSAEANPAIWANLVAGVLKEDRGSPKPFIILFDNEQILDAAKLTLPVALSAFLRANVAIATM